MTRIIDDLSCLIDNYDLFIVDIWGVVHNDGTRTFDGVIPLLQKIKSLNKKVVFLSNAPRRKHEIETTLSKIGILPEYYDNIHTSGEETRETLKNEATTFKKCFSIGLSHGLLEDTGLEITENIDEAECILGAGFLKNEAGEWERETLTRYEPIIQQAIQRNLTWICPNPDLIVRTIAGELLCPGSIAEMYKKAGGKVEYQGKPYPNVYKRIFRWFKDIDRSKILAIGDGINTDILGANNAGIDSVLIVKSGIHIYDIWDFETNSINESKLKNFLNTQKAVPTYAAPLFQ